MDNTAPGSGNLRGKVAVVTGGARGIGLGITNRLLAEGADVMIAARDTGEVEAAGTRVVGGASRFEFFSGNLAVPGVAERLLEETESRLGRVDILVNNAGGGVIRPTLQHTEETIEATITNNLWTNLRCTLAVLPRMVAQGGGRIVSIGAESVRSGLIDHAVYNAAKGGVHALATGLAREFAPHSITVNVVAPSYVRNDDLDAGLASGQVPARIQEVIDEAVKFIPLGRGAEVGEVAAMVAFLAGDDAGFVTGQVISVNGGQSML